MLVFGGIDKVFEFVMVVVYGGAFDGFGLIEMCCDCWILWKIVFVVLFR